MGSREIGEESKWFEPYNRKDRRYRRFHSVRRAVTLEEAFEKSVEKWELIVDGWEPHNPAETCGLCNLFINDDYRKSDDCVLCPIYKETGKIYCESTPNERWEREYWESEDDSEIAKVAAREELEFLQMIKSKYLIKGE